MSRCANYQYGVLLTPGVNGKMAQGIGMGQSTGTVAYFAPTYEIRETGTKLTIEGVEMEVQMTPGTEALAEMNTWLPQFNALWIVENCTGTLHNLYTLRGAAVSDGAAWAKYITEDILRLLLLLMVLSTTLERQTAPLDLLLVDTNIMIIRLSNMIYRS